jgi:hypothetical protein
VKQQVQFTKAVVKTGLYFAAAYGVVCCFTPDVGTIGGLIHNAAKGAFGVNRIVLAWFVAWGAVIHLLKLKQWVTWACSIAFVTVTSIALSLLFGVDMGTITAAQSAKLIKAFGRNGTALIVIYAYCVPALLYREQIGRFIKKTIIPEILAIIPKLKPKPMKTAAPDIQIQPEDEVREIANGVYTIRPRMIGFDTAAAVLPALSNAVSNVSKLSQLSTVDTQLDSVWTKRTGGQPEMPIDGGGGGDWTVNQVIRLRQQGLSLRAIAQQVGVSKSTVSNILVKLNESEQ